MDQPFLNLIVQGPHVQLPDFLHRTSGQPVSFRGEKTLVYRGGIGTAQQLDGGDVVGRSHARIGGVKLVVQALFDQVLVDGIDPLSQNETGSLLQFGNEKAQRPAYGTGHADAFSLHGHQGKLAINAAYPLRISGPDQLNGLLSGQIINYILLRIAQVYHLVYIFMVHFLSV
jgi:hypothetical protein